MPSPLVSFRTIRSERGNSITSMLTIIMIIAVVVAALMVLIRSVPWVGLRT